GDNLLAIDGIGAANNCDLAHLGATQQDLFDLARCDILAATDDDIAEASGDVDIAVGILIAEIAGAKPAIRKRTLPGAARVARSYARAADTKLADLTGRDI